MFDTNLENWARDFCRRYSGNYQILPNEAITEILNHGFNDGYHRSSYGYDRINWRHPESRVWISQVIGDPERGCYFEIW